MQCMQQGIRRIQRRSPIGLPNLRWRARQLYDEVLHIFLQINTFSIERASGSVFLRKWLSEFVLDDSEEPATGMSWIRRVQIERLATSAWPSYHRFLVSCPQLSNLTIVLKEGSHAPDFSLTVATCGFDYPVFAQVLTRLTTVVLDTTKSRGPGEWDRDPWETGSSKTKRTLEWFIPDARVWFSKRKGGEFKVVVQILGKSYQKIDFQILPRVQLTNNVCNKFGLEHGVAATFNQRLWER